MSRRIITLTTDFGTGSPYVAQMKGVILRIDPESAIVDITHEVAPQNIRQAALVLEEIAPRFPDATAHVCVVDPGVGTDRKIVLVQAGSQFFIAPDNGVLSRIVRSRPPAAAVALTNRDYWLHPVSSTFHGRDIMAPVAAHFCSGVPPGDFGTTVERLEMLDWPEPRTDGRQLRGSVLYVDSFGNLITNIDRDLVQSLGEPALLQVRCGGRTVRGIVRTYGEAPAGSLIALFGSGDRLEVAVVEGSAARRLGAEPDQEVIVTR